MRTAINMENLSTGQFFNRGQICSSKYVLIEKDFKFFNGKKYSKIQHIGVELTGKDFTDIKENDISLIPSDSIVYLSHKK